MAPMLAALPTDSDGEKAGTIFEQVNGLPTHPLVVHFAVVLLPLSALALLLILIVPRLRRPLGWLVLLGLFVSVGAALVAKETGEAFTRLVGNPERHADLGDKLPLLAAALFGLALIWYLVWWAGDRKRRKAQATTPAGAAGASAAATSGASATLPGGVSQAELDAVLGTGGQAASASAGTQGSGATGAQSGTDDSVGGRSILQLILGVLTGLLALVTIYWTIQTGHSGAEAVWAGRINPTPAPTASPTAGPTESPTASPSASPTGAPAPGTYTMADVAKHNTAADCWSVVNNKVYNLTDWINAHPGGQGPIEGMCGIDATTAFTNQHGGQGQPEAELATFKIGTLG